MFHQEALQNLDCSASFRLHLMSPSSSLRRAKDCEDVKAIL